MTTLDDYGTLEQDGESACDSTFDIPLISERQLEQDGESACDSTFDIPLISERQLK